MNIQSNLLFKVALLALLVGADRPCTACDEGNPPPEGYTGVWVVTGNDGRNISEVSYKDGKRHGLARGWHPNGQLLFVAHYRKGHPEGISATWDEEGLLTRLTVHEPDGTYRRVDYSKGHHSQEEISKDGKLLSRRMWHSTGLKANEYSCKNGKPHGNYTEWHPNGKCRKRGSYEEGVRVGKWIGWNAEGKLERAWHYENGKLMKIDIYENEKVVAVEYWKNGKAVRTESVE